MSVEDIINKIDIELLKEQASTLEGIIGWIDEEKSEFVDPEYAERLEIDKENLVGLLELVDNIICEVEGEEDGTY